MSGRRSDGGGPSAERDSPGDDGVILARQTVARAGYTCWVIANA